MLSGKICTVGTRVSKSLGGFTSYKAVIVTEPELVPHTEDWYLLVEVGGKLVRVDTDYIFDIEIEV